MTCKHNDRFGIREFGQAYTDHSFEDGDVTHVSGVDKYTGRCEFLCFECDYSIAFYVRSKSLPKWLMNRYQRAREMEAGDVKS